MTRDGAGSAGASHGSSSPETFVAEPAPDSERGVADEGHGVRSRRRYLLWFLLGTLLIPALPEPVFMAYQFVESGSGTQNYPGMVAILFGGPLLIAFIGALLVLLAWTRLDIVSNGIRALIAAGAAAVTNVILYVIAVRLLVVEWGHAPTADWVTNGLTLVFAPAAVVLATSLVCDALARHPRQTSAPDDEVELDRQRR